LSNEVDFDDSKEEYLADLNKFIAEHIHSIHVFFDKLAAPIEPSKSLFPISPEAEMAAISTISKLIKENKDRIFPLLNKPETKKTFLHLVEGGISKIPSREDLYVSDPNSSWLTPKKKKLENLKKKMQQVEKLERLEKSLEDEVHARRSLEKKVNELGNQLEDQKKLNETLQLKMATLERCIEQLKNSSMEPLNTKTFTFGSNVISEGSSENRTSVTQTPDEGSK